VRRNLAVIVTALVVLAACGSDGGDGADAADPTTTFEDIGPPPTNPDKPDVQIPAELPSELVRTVLSEGEGDAAENGDTVIVDYIGVRSVDGVEFDNSYDRFTPFSVTLGAGGVIQGWDQGLLGARTGDRLQLDIPSELAYGSQARSDVIGADEDLTFVIDVRAVIKRADPADQPTEPGVDASEGATELTTVDLVEGDGPRAESGDTAVLHIVLFRGDSLMALDTTWEAEAIQIPLTPESFPAIAEGVPGMRVGGRRTVIAPPDKAFGPTGNPQLGLPADTDVILVVDLLGVY
jgi:peptidylprolyl isomerase